MSYLIIFISSGVLAYWFTRTLLILNRTEEEIDQVLESDLWWARKVLLGIRTSFLPPTHLAG